jgi:predicted DNA-binding transcriptional regulator AlpA
MIAAETLRKRAVRESHDRAIREGMPVHVIGYGVQNALLPDGQRYTIRQLCVALGITQDQVYTLQKGFWFPRPRGDHGRITGALFGTSEVNTWILSNRDRLSQLRQINRQIEDSFPNAEESAQHEGR